LNDVRHYFLALTFCGILSDDVGKNARRFAPTSFHWKMFGVSKVRDQLQASIFGVFPRKLDAAYEELRNHIVTFEKGTVEQLPEPRLHYFASFAYHLPLAVSFPFECTSQ